MSDGGINEYGAKHPLIVYRFIAKKYQPAAIVLLMAGLIAQLPWFVPALRINDSFPLTYQQLGLLGLLMMLVGLALYVASIFRRRRAWVQCQPDYILINTAGNKVAVAYQRINSIKPVRVKDVFKIDDIKSGHRQYAKKLAGESAVELDLSEFPLPEKELRRRLSPLMISVRGTAFVFIVPHPSKLSTEIDVFIQRARDKKTSEQNRYLDPIERARFGTH